MQISIQKMQKLCDQKIVNEIYQKKQEKTATNVLKTRSTMSLNEDLGHITIEEIFNKKPKIKKTKKSGDIKKISPWGPDKSPNQSDDKSE